MRLTCGFEEVVVPVLAAEGTPVKTCRGRGGQHPNTLVSQAEGGYIRRPALDCLSI